MKSMYSSAHRERADSKAAIIDHQLMIRETADLAPALDLVAERAIAPLLDDPAAAVAEIPARAVDDEVVRRVGGTHTFAASSRSSPGPASDAWSNAGVGKNS